MNYHQAHILPVLLDQRRKLDEYISPEDKMTLKNCQHRELSIYQRMQRRQPASPGTSQSGLSAQQQRSALIAENAAVNEQVKLLAAKYADALAQTAKKVQPLKQQWAIDLEALKKKYANPTAKTPEPNLTMAQIEHWFSPVPFLLLEPHR